MLSEHVRVPLFEALTKLLRNLRPDPNGLVCNLCEVVVREAEQLGGESAVAQITADLTKTGLFQKLLDGLRGSWIAHCTTGPLRRGKPVDGIVETDYFSILARLILSSTNAFLQACRDTAPPVNSAPASVEVTMEWLLEEWFSPS